MLPRQLDKTSSVEEKQWNTTMRLKKPLLVTMSSMLSSSASGGTEDGIATFKDRVNLQKIHNADLRAVGETAIPDRGIIFDDDKMPRDTKLGQGLLRGGFRLASGRGQSTNDQNNDSRRKERDKGMPTGKQGGPPSGGPDGNGGGDGDEPSDSKDDEEDGSELPTDEEEDVEGMIASHATT